MKRKLTAKIQKLNPPQEEVGRGFAQSLVIEPETRKLALQKGTIYAVYDISSEEDIEITVISKIIKDLLHDVYFQTESVSPTQTLEKTLLEIRNRVTQMDEKKSLKFNMVATVLWGNVLYSVQFGTGKSYIVQEGEIRPISTMSEGNFSAASGVVNDDDVVILSTEAFDREYPPKKLLAASIPETELDKQQAALLMKFIVDAEFSENEIVDFGLETGKKSSKFKDKLKSTVEKTKGVFTKKKVNVKHREFNIPRKFMLFLIFAFLGMPLIALIIRKAGRSETQLMGTSEPVTEAPAEPKLLGTNVEREGNQWDEDKDQDKDTGTVRVSPEALYDIRIIDDTALPSEIELVETKIILAEKGTGRVFVSEMDTPNFEATTLEFPGINSLNDSKGFLSFNDSEGFKYMDVETLEVIDSYEVTGLGLTDTYLDFIYSAGNGKITKYTDEAGQLQKEIWGESEDFNNISSISIAYSIFLATNEGEILKYTSGEKDTFEISGLNTPIGKSPKLFADTKLENVYVLDPDNRRIVVLDDTGEFVTQYKTDKEGEWDNLIDLSVTDSERYIYLLNGTKVYLLDMETVETEKNTSTGNSSESTDAVGSNGDSDTTDSSAETSETANEETSTEQEEPTGETDTDNQTPSENTE